MQASEIHRQGGHAESMKASELLRERVTQQGLARALKAYWASPTSPRMLGNLRRWVGRAAYWAIWHTAMNSGASWGRHCAAGGASGPKSRGVLALTKADIVNRSITEYCLDSVPDLECGDRYSRLLLLVNHYTGLDPALMAARLCIDRCRQEDTKTVMLYTRSASTPHLDGFTPDMFLSLHVKVQPLEQRTFERFRIDLVRLARRLLLIYSSNGRRAHRQPEYTRRRVFADWIRENISASVPVGEYPRAYLDLSRGAFWGHMRASGGL